MAKNVFGLDVGSSIIKVAKIANIKNQLTLVRAGAAWAPEKGIVSESELDLTNLTTAIKKLVTDTKIDTKFVNVALPEQLVYTRVIDVPNLSDKELGSAIQWEAEQYIPSPLNEVVLDYQIIQRPADPSGTMKMLLVAAPIVLINKYKKVLEAVGLVPFVFETEALSMTRIVQREKPDATVLLLSIGAGSTTVAILHQGILVSTFSVPLGGVAMTKAVSADLGFDAGTSEEYKRTYGLTQELEGKVATVISPIVKGILTEVEKNIKFYQEKYAGGRIESILLFGGAAKLPGLPSRVAETFGIEAEVVNPWNGISVDEALFGDVLTNGPMFATALGLALRDYD